jgi:hypothetical protein
MHSLRTLVVATARFGSKVQRLKANRQLCVSSTFSPASGFRAVHSSRVNHQGPIAKPKEEEKVYKYLYNSMFMWLAGRY